MDDFLPKTVKKVEGATKTKLNEALGRMLHKYVSSKTETVEAFKQILINNNAIIAGGSIFNIVSDLYKSHLRDIDIYVPVENYSNFQSSLQALLELNRGRQHLAPAYDGSFLRKNNIALVETYYFIDYFSIDVMYVKGTNEAKERLQNVVTNFDLTCCEIWYDGTDFFASQACYTSLFDQGKGTDGRYNAYLRKEYVQSLLNDNEFIKNRLSKYWYKGVNIKLELPKDVEYMSIKAKNMNNRGLSVIDDERNGPIDWLKEKVYSKVLQYLEKEKTQNVIYAYSTEIINNILNKPNDNINDLKEFLKTVIPEVVLQDKSLEDIIDSYLKMIMSNFRGRATEERDNKLRSLIGKLLNSRSSRDLKDVMAFYEIASIKTFSDTKIELEKPVDVYDVIDTESQKYDDYIGNIEMKDKVVIISGSKGSTTAIGMDRSYIAHLSTDYENSWFQECHGPMNFNIDYKNSYIAIPVDKDGMKGLIPVAHISKLLDDMSDDTRKNRVFYVEFIGIIPFTTSMKNSDARRFNPDWLSSNHCQNGSTYAKYEIRMVKFKSSKGGTLKQNKTKNKPNICDYLQTKTKLRGRPL